MLAAAAFTALSLASPVGAEAPEPVPQVQVASHNVSVTFRPKLCPKGGACTAEAPFVGHRLPAHRGGMLIVRTGRPVPNLRLLYFRRRGRPYARGLPNAARTMWTFRIPEREGFKFSRGEVGWRELALDIDYGDVSGFMGLHLAEHPHSRFRPPPIVVGSPRAWARPRFCTWLVFDPLRDGGRDACGYERDPRRALRFSALPGQRVLVGFRAPVVWAELYEGEREFAPEYAPLRREDATGTTWSFRVRPSKSMLQRLKLEIAYHQGFGTLLLDLVPPRLAAKMAATVRATRPRTLLVFPGITRDFDYDAGRVAWIDSAWALRVRVVRSGATQKFLYTNPYEEIPDFSDRPRMLLQQRRLAWLSRRGRGMFAEADHVYLGTVTPLRGRRVATAAHGEGSEGSYVLGLGGDGVGFSYGLAEVRATDPDFSGFRVVGGGVFSLIGGERRRVPGAPPAIVLGRAAGRVAIAPVNTAEQRDGEPVAAGPVEIRNANTGTLVSRFSPGPVRAFAISPRIAAVLTRRQIDRYDIASGRLLGSTQVPADVADDLDVEGPRIVFRRMRSIGLLDAATGKVSTVATTEWRPAAVRIDGDTVAWAEQRRIAPGEVSKKTFRARIRTVTLR